MKTAESFSKLRGCQNLALSSPEATARRERIPFHLLMEVQLIHHVFVSGVQQRDAVIRIHVLSHVLSHYRSLQGTQHCSLCYTAGLGCSLILS